MPRRRTFIEAKRLFICSLVGCLLLVAGSSGHSLVTKTVHAEGSRDSVQVIEEFESLALLSSSSAQANTVSLELVERPKTIYYGNHAVNLRYDFTGKTGTSAAYLNLKNENGSTGKSIPGYPKKLGVWVYGDGNNHWLRAQLEDSRGTKIAADFTTSSGLSWTGWKYVTLQVPSSMTPPLKINQIYVAETKDNNKNSGEIYFDHLSALYSDEPLTGLDVIGAEPLQAGNSEKLISHGTFINSTEPDVIQSGVSYTSSNEEVATVTTSTYTQLDAVSPGTTTITATYGGIRSETVVVVHENEIVPSELQLSGPTTMEVSAQGKIRAYAIYGDRSHPYLVHEEAAYSSSDEQVLTVTEDGNLQALKAGNANISVTYKGVTASLLINVSEAVPLLQGIEMTGDSWVTPGSSFSTEVFGHYTLITEPVPLTDGVTYTSSQPQIASVNTEGQVTGVSVGGTRISANYEGKSTSIYVVVTEAASNPKREVRAAWIATVENIDWPNKGTVEKEEQKQQFRNRLNQLEEAGINTLIVQVKPTADAFYPSDYAPWSEWLTGVQGQDPGYDPLAFMLEEAHLRGMEFHAWFNPYRVSMQSDVTKLVPDHPARLHPDWVESYGGKLYFNPGVPEAREYIVDTIMEVVNNYDIDGVHFDDYFYPYPAASGDFPDSDTYAQYGAGFTNIKDWRRNNVNQFVREVGEQVKSVRNDVKYGISPFGIWKNKSQDPLGSETSGLSSYDAIYADSKKWVDEEWIDYIMPQVYWYMGYAPAAYDKLADWWSHVVSGKNVHLYIGQALYRNGTVDGWLNPEEMPNQIAYNRSHDEIKGSAFFSAKWFESNVLGFTDRLSEDLFRYPALIPTMPWLDQDAPSSPVKVKAKINTANVSLEWESAGTDERYYVIYRYNGLQPINLNQVEHIVAKVQRTEGNKFRFTDEQVPKGIFTYVITAVDRLHNESSASKAISAKIRK